MSVPVAFDAILYAKDLEVVAPFYLKVLDAVPLQAERTHVVLGVGGGRLWVHAIPVAMAASIAIAHPPELREESAIKLSFSVASLSRARELVTAHGGGVAAVERAWEHQGSWLLDAWDPEGNVFQLSAPALYESDRPRPSDPPRSERSFGPR